MKKKELIVEIKEGIVTSVYGNIDGLSVKVLDYGLSELGVDEFDKEIEELEERIKSQGLKKINIE